MGNILDFPTPKAQGLAFLEGQLQGILSAKGADDQLIEFAAAKLTEVYTRVTETESYSFSVQLPDGIDGEDRSALEEQINCGLADIRRSTHSTILELIAQLVLTEVQLFQLQRD